MLATIGSAAPPSVTQAEIDHLLTFVGISNCEFYRNGTWYDATQAQAHLHEKLALLSARDQMRSAEDFIERVATRSAFTNLPYQVRCGGGEAVAVNGWLQDELQRYRQCASAPNRCVSRLSRDTPDIAWSRSAQDFNHLVEP